MVARAPWLLLAGAIACSPPELALSPPPQIEWVAIVRDGESTGLWRIRELPLRASTPGSALVVGWSDAELRAALGELPDAEVLAGAKLRPSTPCEQGLPPAAWSVRAEGGAIAEDAAEPPWLTADWALERCDPVDPELTAVCGGAEGCPLISVVQAGCSLELKTGCSLDTLQVRIGRGGLCPVAPVCTADRTDPDGVIGYRCPASFCPGGSSNCSCDVKIAPAPQPPPAQLDRLAFGAGMPRLPEQRPIDNDFQYAEAITGYLSSPIAIDDGGQERLVLSVLGWTQLASCVGSTPSTLVFVDTASAEQVRTVSAPPCLTHLAPDPTDPSSFIAVARDPSASLELVRFNRRGEVTQRMGVPVDPAAVLVEVAGMVGGPEGAVWLALRELHDPNGRPTHARFLRVDAATFAVTHTRVETNFRATALIRTEEPWLVTFDELANLVIWFDLELGRCLGSSKYSVAAGEIFDLGSIPPLSLFSLSRPRRIVVALNEKPSLLFLDDLCINEPLPGERCAGPTGACLAGRRATSGERGIQPLGAMTWTAIPNRIVVAAMRRANQDAWSFEAALATVDPATLRYEGGVRLLGHGIARDLLEDRQGRLWITLPWSGELLRLSAPARSAPRPGAGRPGG
jgi:hypothetical protein